MTRKPALGRGLKALIPETPRARAGLSDIPVGRIRPNPNQPRHRFDDEALAELATSIAAHGLLQPLLVSQAADGGYVLIAGERRWRAAQRAGLATVPAVIREHLEEGKDLELALVENLQRRDLTPIEEARAFEAMRTGLGLTQADIAARVGVDRSTVANALRLLKLPPAAQEMLEDGRLGAGHARTLLAFPEPERERWAERAVAAGMSVRELERAAAEPAPTPARRRKTPPPDPNVAEAEERLSLRLGAKVRIRQGRRGGEIVIRCASQDELMRLYGRLLGEDGDGTGE